MKTSTKVLKVNAGFREVSHFGVAHHMNADNSVAYFRSWQDLDKGTAGGMSGLPMHPGIPMTQGELDTYYPALKENTMLTKSKIGSGKVRFKDLQQPLACMYQGKVYLVAPYAPEDTPVLPKSMTKPKHTTEQQKYLDAHKREDVAGYSPKVIAFDKDIEYTIREAKRLEKQGFKVHIQSVPSPHGRPGYTLSTLGRDKSGTEGDEVVIGDHSIVRIGTTVMTKRGAGELRGIDTTTYSIPFCSVQLTDEGPHKYEHIYVAAAELTQKKVKKAATPKRKPAPTPNLPPILTAPPELAADVLGTGPTLAAPKRKPAAKPRKTSGVKYTKIVGRGAHRVWTADMTDHEDMSSGERSAIIHILTRQQSWELTTHRQCELTDAQSKEIGFIIAARSSQNYATLIQRSIKNGTHNGYVRGKTYYALPGYKIAFGDYIDLHFRDDPPAGMHFPLKLVSAKNHYSTVEYKTCVEVVVKDANGVKYSFTDAHLLSPSKGEPPSQPSHHTEKEQKQVNIVNNPHGTGYVIQFRTHADKYLGDMRGGTATFETANRAGGRAERLGYEVMSKPKATKHKPAPNLPPILTAPPELAADVLGTGPMGLTPTVAPKPKRKPAARKPAPNLPPILTAPPELAADVLGTGPMGLPPTAAPGRKPAARTTKPKAKKTPAAKPRKTTKKTAKPKAKKTAAAPKLTASQREYLAIQGFVMVKRGGKYVKITG